MKKIDFGFIKKYTEFSNAITSNIRKYHIHNINHDIVFGITDNNNVKIEFVGIKNIPKSIIIPESVFEQYFDNLIEQNTLNNTIYQLLYEADALTPEYWVSPR
jgi:hypothetical protein